ncbi:hypothetical protein E4U26_003282 [Claviceps purpurea]|nr:hypothetical protein E4U26_003282 [Claviceps purpurea]
MARALACLATLLAARNALVQAKPVHDERPLPTLDVRPIRVVTELGVSLSMRFPAPTNLVFCNGETLSISQAGFLSTVTTITHTQNASISSFAPCGTIGSDQIAPTDTCDCSAFSIGVAGVGLVGPMGLAGPQGPPGPPGPACTTIYTGGAGAGAGTGAGAGAGAGGSAGSGGDQSGSLPAEAGSGDAGNGDISGGGGNNDNGGNGGDGGAQSALATELDPIISSIVEQLTTLVPTGTSALPTEVAPIVSSLIGDLSSLFHTGIPTSILPTATSVNNGNEGTSGDGGAQSALATELDPIISSIVGQLTTLVPTGTGALPTDVTPIVSSLIGDLSSLFPTGIPTSILPTATGVNNDTGGTSGDGGAQSALATELDPIISSIVEQLTTLVPTATGTVPTDVAPIVSSLIDDLSSLFPTGIPTSILPTATSVNSSLPLSTEVQSVVSNLPSSLPTGQLSSTIEGVVSDATNVLPTNTTPNLPTCAPGNPVCAIPPEACRKIGDISDANAGSQLASQLAECTAALGPFAEDSNVSNCTGNVALGPGPILACVTNALSDVCITAFPSACTNLLDVPAAQLSSVAPQCAHALGPFLVDDTDECLTGTLTSGDAVVSCLEKALGLSACVPTANDESTQVGNLATETEAITLPLPSQVQSIVNEVTSLLPTLPTLPTCSASPPVCASVPQDCNAIGKISGLGAVTQLPGQIAKCTTALGSFATNPAVASCLQNVAQGPTAIVNCLTTSLKSVCITELPGACTNLLGKPAAQLPSVAPQCALALGPFLVNDASQCLNALTSGLDVVSCLEKALGLSACVPTASGESTQVGNLATETEGLTLPLPSQVQSSVNEATTLLPSKVQTVVEGVTTSLPIVSVSVPIAQISSIIGAITNVVPSNTVPSLATCSAGPPVCASVPQDCNAIGKISGLGAVTQLPGQIVKCTTALGSFATNPAVASCLQNVAQGPTAIVNCLTTSLKSVCITELPGACTNLLGKPAAQLPSVAPQCALALGPFLVNDASQCLNALTSGVDVVSCLEKALGLSVCVPTASGESTQVGSLATETEALTLPLPSKVTTLLPTLPTLPTEVQSIVNEITTLLPALPTLPSEVQSIVNEVTSLLPTLPTLPSEVQSIVNEVTNLLPTLPTLPTCSASPPVCASVPQDCNAIGKISGLSAVTQLPGQIAKCTTALGSFATNPAVASCLQNVAQGPTAIVNCLTTSLKSVCITELPGACTNLLGKPAAQLPSVAPQCALALGPFLVNDASQCLNALTSGLDVVSCLEKALGLSACVPTASGGGTQISNLATETEASMLPLPSKVQTAVEGVTTSLPIVSVSVPIAQISSIIGAITNVVPSNTVPSLATCSAGPPVCASVPQDCNAIGKISGLGAVTQLPGQIAKCTTALGSFATNPAVASCLSNVAQGPTAIVNCLTTSLKSVCITELPGACTNLLGEPAAQLPSVAPQCALALGPFLVNDASQCLNALTSGLDVVSCLEKALGLSACVPTASGESTQVGSLATKTEALTLPLPSKVTTFLPTLPTQPSQVQSIVEGVTTRLPIVSVSVPIAEIDSKISSVVGVITNVIPSNTVAPVATCSAGPPVCASVPQDCNAIGKISGLGAVTQLPGQIVKCTTALGSFATNPAVASCLSNVAQGPTAIVNCLTTSLKSVCITELPGACKDLVSASAAQLVMNAPQCTLALGPFLVHDAAQCLNALTSGVDVVTCLQKAIGLSVCV